MQLKYCSSNTVGRTFSASDRFNKYIAIYPLKHEIISECTIEGLHIGYHFSDLFSGCDAIFVFRENAHGGQRSPSAVTMQKFKP